jgi:hypothetical protein
LKVDVTGREGLLAQVPNVRDGMETILIGKLCKLGYFSANLIESICMSCEKRISISICTKVRICGILRIVTTLSASLDCMYQSECTSLNMCLVNYFNET